MASEILQGTAILEITLDSREVAEMVCKALNPETDSAPSDRAIAALTTRENILLVNISAEDLTALRAAMNSYLVWISGCVRAMDSVTGQNP